MGGIKFKDDRERYYRQENNSVERFLAYAKKMEKLTHWTESCGPTSAIRIADGMGLLDDFKHSILIQLEDYLWCGMNDFTNDAAFRAVRMDVMPGSIPGNRIPQYYPPVLRKLFGIESYYDDGLDFETIAKSVLMGDGVLLCLVDPGHYVAAVDYVGGFIIYDDPFPSRFPDGNGWHLKMDRAMFEKNVRTYGVIFKGRS